MERGWVSTAPPSHSHPTSDQVTETWKVSAVGKWYKKNDAPTHLLFFFEVLSTCPASADRALSPCVGDLNSKQAAISSPKNPRHKAHFVCEKSTKHSTQPVRTPSKAKDMLYHHVPQRPGVKRRCPLRSAIM
jgi:hypothetical protein